MLGDSAKFSAADQARLLGQAWEKVEGSNQLRTRLVAYRRGGEIEIYHLGAHTPTLTLQDLDLIHRLGLDAVGEVGLDIHHRDIVRVALEELGAEMKGRRRPEAMARLRKQASRPPGQPAPLPADHETPSDPGAR